MTRELMSEEILAYAETDLLFYRGEGKLRVLQAECFDPVLDWAKKKWNLEFNLADGIMPVKQPPANQAVFARVVAALDDAGFAAINRLTRVTGSLLLALALYEGEMTVEAVFKACRLDENQQAEGWGVTDTHEARNRRILEEIQAVKDALTRLKS